MRIPRFPFLTGALAGVLLVFAGQFLVNRTPVADWIVAPLFMADSTGATDAIVVLGAGVIGDCVPNQHALRRVLLAVRHWRAQPSSLMLFSGGTGGGCPVAEAMARTARELGVPDERLRVETTSTNTHENAVLTTALLRGWGISRALLVTDRLHMRRATAAFERLGFSVQRASVPLYEGHEDNMSMLSAGLREFVALGYYRMRGWIAGAGSGVSDPSAPMPPVPQRVSSVGSGPIVLLGASYAAGWPLRDVGGVPVINKGIAGQQSFELLQRFDTDVVPAAPRAVILWGFINDLFRSPPDGMEGAIARVKDSYTQMINQARARGIEPVLATEVTARPRAESLMDTLTGWAGTLLGKAAYQDQINRHVLAVNQWLIETATREGVLILHLQAVLAEPGGRRRPAFAQPDGSHITPAGYDMLTSYARPVLQEFLVAR